MMGSFLLPVILLCALLAVTIVGLVKSNAAAKRLDGSRHRPDRAGAGREGSAQAF
jgi:hypothetical protein